MIKNSGQEERLQDSNELKGIEDNFPEATDVEHFYVFSSHLYFFWEMRLLLKIIIAHFLTGFCPFILFGFGFLSYLYPLHVNQLSE